MTVAEALLRIRREDGLTQDSLARLTGFAPSTICKWEKGRLPTLKRLQQVAAVTNRNFILKVSDKSIFVSLILREYSRDIGFDKALWKLEPSLKSFCSGILNVPRQELDDLVQETFYRALKLYNSWDRKVALMTWICGIARVAHYRKKSKLVYIESYVEFDALGEITDSYYREHVNAFNYVDALGGRKRKMYQSYLSGYSHEETATMLGLSPVYVKTRINKIKQELRRLIEGNELGIK
jgi:RNA polymerase sigma factor (sigma-70 family)